MSDLENDRTQEPDGWGESYFLVFEKPMRYVQLNLNTLSRLEAKGYETMGKAMSHVTDFASGELLDLNEIESRHGFTVARFVAALAEDVQEGQRRFDVASKKGQHAAEVKWSKARAGSDGEPPENGRYAHT